MEARVDRVQEKPVRLAALAVILTLWALPGLAEEVPLGSKVEDLLTYAREHNPDLQGRRLDAEAQRERIEPASALPDPKFQVELMDFTNAMTPGKSASLAPAMSVPPATAPFRHCLFLANEGCAARLPRPRLVNQSASAMRPGWRSKRRSRRPTPAISRQPAKPEFSAKRCS